MWYIKSYCLFYVFLVACFVRNSGLAGIIESSDICAVTGVSASRSWILVFEEHDNVIGC